MKCFVNFTDNLFLSDQKEHCFKVSMYGDRESLLRILRLLESDYVATDVSLISEKDNTDINGKCI